MIRMVGCLRENVILSLFDFAFSPSIRVTCIGIVQAIIVANIKRTFISLNSKSISSCVLTSSIVFNCAAQS